MAETSEQALKTEIRGSVEYFEIRPGHWASACARCGSSVEHLDCMACGGEGTVERDLGDDVCPELIDVPCPECHGHGGTLHCVSSRAYCAANPIPGREAVPSTALSSEAWRDAD